MRYGRYILTLHACVLCLFSHVQLFAALWTSACQAPLSMWFSRQECWRRLPFPFSGDLPDPGIKPESPVAPLSPADSLPLSYLERPLKYYFTPTFLLCFFSFLDCLPLCYIFMYVFFPSSPQWKLRELIDTFSVHSCIPKTCVVYDPWWVVS